MQQKAGSQGVLHVQTLQVMHPLGLTDDWADKLANERFFSPNAQATFEHYMQVCPAPSLMRLSDSLTLADCRS